MEATAPDGPLFIEVASDTDLLSLYTLGPKIGEYVFLLAMLSLQDSNGSQSLVVGPVAFTKRGKSFGGFFSPLYSLNWIFIQRCEVSSGTGDQNCVQGVNPSRGCESIPISLFW